MQSEPGSWDPLCQQRLKAFIADTVVLNTRVSCSQIHALRHSGVPQGPRMDHGLRARAHAVDGEEHRGPARSAASDERHWLRRGQGITVRIPGSQANPANPERPMASAAAPLLGGWTGRTREATSMRRLVLSGFKGFWYANERSLRLQCFWGRGLERTSRSRHFRESWFARVALLAVAVARRSLFPGCQARLQTLDDPATILMCCDSYVELRLPLPFATSAGKTSENSEAFAISAKRLPKAGAYKGSQTSWLQLRHGCMEFGEGFPCHAPPCGLQGMFSFSSRGLIGALA